MSPIRAGYRLLPEDTETPKSFPKADMPDDGRAAMIVSARFASYSVSSDFEVDCLLVLRSVIDRGTNHQHVLEFR